MRFSRILLSLIVAFVVCAGLPGCSSGDKKAGEEDAPVVVPTPTPRPPGSYEKLGEVVLVNEVAGFVLVDVGLYVPLDGEALKAFAEGVLPAETGETAVLAVSAERARPFVVADIVAGTPSKGDLVYR